MTNKAGEAVAGTNIRQATRADAGAIQRLLRHARYTHTHVDWHLPGDWLGTPGFVVFTAPGRQRAAIATILSPPSRLTACLAVAADPLPAAWVRIAAVESADGYGILSAMLAHLLQLLDPAINEIAWFLTDDWPEAWLTALQFSIVNRVITYRKSEMSIPPYETAAGLVVRPVAATDYVPLEQIEARAFEPRWRHSAEALRLARQQALSFDVAELNGEIVGYQFCTRGRYGAHLARMTVHPAAQGQGIGSTLLAAAVSHADEHGLRHLTLNTQDDNLASQRLYTRFGFQPTGQSFPVWSRPR